MLSGATRSAFVPPPRKRVRRSSRRRKATHGGRASPPLAERRQQTTGSLPPLSASAWAAQVPKDAASARLLSMWTPSASSAGQMMSPLSEAPLYCWARMAGKPAAVRRCASSRSPTLPLLRDDRPRALRSGATSRIGSLSFPRPLAPDPAGLPELRPGIVQVPCDL